MDYMALLNQDSDIEIQLKLSKEKRIKKILRKVSPSTPSPIHSPCHSSSLKSLSPSFSEDLDRETLQQMSSHQRSHIKLMQVDAEKSPQVSYRVRLWQY